MPFNYEKALEAGYSENEVADFLGMNHGFNVNEARKVGYTNREVMSFLAPQANLRGLPKSYQRFEEEGTPTTSAKIVDVLANLVSALQTPSAKEAARLYTETGDPSGLMAIGLSPEAGILGGVKGAKALGKLTPTMRKRTPSTISAIKELREAQDLHRLWSEMPTGMISKEAIEWNKLVMKDKDTIINALKGREKYKEESINLLKRMRYSHQYWVDESKAGRIIPEKFGDVEWHKRWVNNYNKAIIEVKTKSPLKQAILDTHQGVDAEKVWKETGWTKDPSGKWMFRIDDSAMKLKKEGVIDLGAKPVKLGYLIEHDKLFKAYPGLKNIQVRLTAGKSGADYFNGKIRLGDTGDMPGALKHEIQHAVQEIEGFAMGVDPANLVKGFRVSDQQYQEWLNLSSDLKWLDGPTMKSIEKRGFKGQAALDEMEKVTDGGIKLSNEAKEIYLFGDKDLIKARLTNLEEIIKKHREQVYFEPYKEYKKHAGEIFAREEGAGFKGMPGTMEWIPRDQWIVKKNEGTSFTVEPKRGQ